MYYETPHRIPLTTCIDRSTRSLGNFRRRVSTSSSRRHSGSDSSSTTPSTCSNTSYVSSLTWSSSRPGRRVCPTASNRSGKTGPRCGPLTHSSPFPCSRRTYGRRVPPTLDCTALGSGGSRVFFHVSGDT